jgi:3-oxoacyl-[acyl-carrier-protein] synthase II
MREGVVITGIGCISCFGIGHSCLVDALAAGSSGIAPISAFDTSGCVSHRAATIRGFDPAAFIPPMKLRRMDAVSRVAAACAQLLFADAGPRIADGASDEAGIALGTFTAGLDSLTEYLTALTDHGPTAVPAIMFSNTISNAPASLCAIQFGLRGPNVTFNQREVSSLAAIAFSVGAVRDGRTTAMVTGGADCIEETFFKVHDRFRALSPMPHSANGASGEEAARPFDRRRNGSILGEGAFLLLLESASVAARRGARVYGEIVGVGATASRTALNGWPVDGSGLARAMRLALADADCVPDDVAAVAAAANGSAHLDRLEASAIADVFGPRPVSVASVKGAVGESGAAGAAALIAHVLSVARGTIGPTVGFEEPDPACAVGVSAERQDVTGDIFLVNGVASGGTNYSIAVRARGTGA